MSHGCYKPCAAMAMPYGKNKFNRSRVASSARLFSCPVILFTRQVFSPGDFPRPLSFILVSSLLNQLTA